MDAQARGRADRSRPVGVHLHEAIIPATKTAQVTPTEPARSSNRAPQGPGRPRSAGLRRWLVFTGLRLRLLGLTRPAHAMGAVRGHARSGENGGSVSAGWHTVALWLR